MQRLHGLVGSFPNTPQPPALTLQAWKHGRETVPQEVSSSGHSHPRPWLCGSPPSSLLCQQEAACLPPGQTPTTGKLSHPRWLSRVGLMRRPMGCATLRQWGMKRCAQRVGTSSAESRARGHSLAACIHVRATLSHSDSPSCGCHKKAKERLWQTQRSFGSKSTGLQFWIFLPLYLYSLSAPQGTRLTLAAEVTRWTIVWSLWHVSGNVSFSVISLMPVSFPEERDEENGGTKEHRTGRHLLGHRISSSGVVSTTSGNSCHTPQIPSPSINSSGKTVPEPHCPDG